MKYGRVPRVLWHERSYRVLDDAARLLLVYLLTGPRSLSIPGVTLARAAVVADDLGWSRKKLAAALIKIAGEVEIDAEAGVMFVARALIDPDGKPAEINKPNSTKAAIGWFQSLDDVVAGTGYDRIVDVLTGYANHLDGEIANVFKERLPTACARRTRAESTPSLLTITNTSINTNTSKRPARKRAVRSPADAGASGHQRVVDRFFELYLAQTGSEYEASVADFAHIKHLVTKHGDEAVIARVEYLFTGKTWIKPPYTIGTLRTQWNTLVPTANGKTANVGQVAASANIERPSGEIAI